MKVARVYDCGFSVQSHILVLDSTPLEQVRLNICQAVVLILTAHPVHRRKAPDGNRDVRSGRYVIWSTRACDMIRIRDLQALKLRAAMVPHHDPEPFHKLRRMAEKL